MPANDRGEILWKAFEKLNERADELALLMTLEMGKPLAESKSEIVYAAEFFRWFSGEALRVEGYYKQAANGQGRVLVLKQPVGPSLMITPWNFPMAMGTRKVGPAIAAGCTVVIKPASQTPLSMLALGQILEECGLPGGAFNIVTTSSSSDVTGPLIDDPRLRKLSFTGSTEVGRKLIAACGRERAEGVDGAGRQRPLPRLRRRRRRRRRRGRAAGQDAQHRRGLHVGQPLPRGGVGGRRVRREARRGAWAR